MSRFRVALAAALVALVATVAFATSALARPVSHKATTTISVSAGEFFFKLSKRSVARGTTVVFKVTNKGQVTHDFSLKGYKKTPYLDPGQSATLKVTFKKAGRIAYLCTVPRHAEQGMAGTFVVK